MSSKTDVADTYVGDMVSKDAAIEFVCKMLSNCFNASDEMLESVKITVGELPSAQPEPEEFEWCHTCREYDQEKHCCHRWTKVIRKTVDEIKAAQPGWIPCTPKTMPKMTDTYLVKVGINENGEGMHTEVRTAEWGVISRTWYVHEHENSIIGEVTEWMQIPWEGGQK